jgi:hypothetical protein
MRIGNQSETGQTKKLKPPPNFQSRGMQLRMFFLLVLLFVVIGAITEARRPENWKWLWALNQNSEEVEVVDSKLSPPQPSAIKNPDEVEMKMEQAVLSDRAKLNDDDPAATQELAWLSAWEALDESFSNQDRRVLFELLRGVAPDPTNPEEIEKSPASVKEMLTRVDEAWDSYLLSSRAALADLSPAEQIAWKHVLDQINERWKLTLQPQLKNRSTGEKVDPKVLQEFQTLLSHVAQRNVQDDTPWRGAEREFWFNLFAQLQAKSAGELSQESTGYVSYSQLFKQSKSYRGKLVTVRGEAVAVYPEPAPKNKYGIKEYWVYWLYPHGGPASPLLVYALKKPAEFPSFTSADLGKKKLASREDVEFHGYFFKRYAYLGQGGIYTAPTLVAVEPNWLQAEKIATAALPSFGVAAMTVLTLAALSALFAIWVYQQYRPGGLREPLERIQIPTPPDSV